MEHLLTNIPSGTHLYMQPEGSPRLGPILFHAHQFTELPFEFPSFSIESPGLLKPRHKIDIRHLVGYYRKYVGPIDSAFFNEEKATEILFIADHTVHKDRSMKELRRDYERGHAFEKNYNCDECYPRTCSCEDDNEVIDIPWAEGPDPTLDPEPDDVAFVPVCKFVKRLIRDLMRDEDVSATINERIETLGRLICEAKAEALVRIQDSEQDMATQLAALDKKHQQLDKYMVDVRAIVEAHR